MNNEMRFESEQAKLAKLGRALKVFQELDAIYQTDPYYPMAYIKCFEMVFELMWKVMQSYIIRVHIPNEPLGSARSTLRFAYEVGLLPELKIWLEMLNERNMAVHTYDDNPIVELCDRIHDKFSQAFLSQWARMLLWKL
jgi:nucleotidyltransferase substrate binding protein (TIGR01987 family)